MFISHSSRRRSEDELGDGDSLVEHDHRKRFLAKLLRTLEAKLDDAGFRPWIDRSRIKPGEEFQAKINDALWNCDLAILLVDRDALDSTWMSLEADVLMLLRSQRATQVLPVLIDKVTTTRLAGSRLGTPSGLNRLTVFVPKTGKENAKTAEPIAAEIVEAVGKLWGEVEPREEDSLSARWITNVTRAIKEIPSDQLEWVAKSLGIDMTAWDQARDHARMVATAMLGAETNKVLEALTELEPLFEKEQSKSTTMRHAVPLWVDLDAAATVAEVMGRQVDQRVVGVATPAYRLGDHVVRRATCSQPRYRVNRLLDIAGENAYDELLKRYDTTLRDQLHLSAGWTPEEIGKRLARYRLTYFALMRAENLSPGIMTRLLGELRGRFPGVVFVVLAGKDNRVWEKMRERPLYGDRGADWEPEAKRYVSLVSELIGEHIPVDSDD
ncbi:toll/interleukin-1 receptor domain-containing protein [Sphaerisporangium album]|uniref:toll/interleukin-1 receptor domain-containing protein n=1 Tax=Sphaerisporangium album TaxID=509200 RepID=UPI0015F07525|nr:toll/interleukin-1 receptor domain-containing protein [Sphaerisporangium album]